MGSVDNLLFTAIAVSLKLSLSFGLSCNLLNSISKPLLSSELGNDSNPKLLLLSFTTTFSETGLNTLIEGGASSSGAGSALGVGTAASPKKLSSRPAGFSATGASALSEPAPPAFPAG